MIRATMLAIVLLFVPLAASAQYLDVIGNELKEDCSLDEYLKVVEAFRGVMKAEGYSYTVEIAQPHSSENLSTIWWIGRTKDLVTYASDYTKWEMALAKPGSRESKVNDKLNDCSKNISRSGMLIR